MSHYNKVKIQECYWFYNNLNVTILALFYFINLPIQWLATGWTVRGSNPGGGARFSAPVHTVAGAHPASYTMDTGSFPRVKRPGRGVDHPPPSRAEVKKIVQLYLYSPSGHSWPVLGWPLPLHLRIIVVVLGTRNTVKRMDTRYPKISELS
jgi:hypothetical protein